MLRRLTNKRALTALGVMAVLAVAGAAFAYFTSEGTGTGQASVGSASNWEVTVEPATGTMFPGAGKSTIAYTVTNVGKGHQNLVTTTTAVAEDAEGNITEKGASVAGCKASWFETANTPPAEKDLAEGQSVNGEVVVTMKDTGEPQNACQGAHPDITIKAN